MKIVIWHNIMWSRYKALVFSAVQTLCAERHSQLWVYQIAETATQRTSLAPMDASLHNYPHRLLFEGSYEDIPQLQLFLRVAKEAWIDDADITILAGYDRPEYWVQAAILLLRGKMFACFCDSTAYDKDQRFFVGLLKTIFFRWCSGIFCYGRRAAEYVEMHRVTPDKIIHRCQAAALYEGYSSQNALERRLAAYDPSRPASFLYVGRFSQEKSIDHLLLAFESVQNVLRSAELVLVGGGPDEVRLRGLCDELGISSKVRFAGARHGKELFESYVQATCLVLPSYSEPWGLVVNEALSHGCPAVVSNRCGCVPELVRDQLTGYQFTWGDTQELAQKMLRIATADDPAGIARACLETVAPFTSESAARSIYDGAVRLCQKPILDQK